MVCIYCGGNTAVANSRLQKKPNQVWRRRVCQECSATVTTLEAVDLRGALVITSEKSHQAFSRDKLFISIFESLKHRKTAQKDATALTDTILNKLYPLIRDAALPREVVTQETHKVLSRFDMSAAVQYAAYHPAKNAKN